MVVRAEAAVPQVSREKCDVLHETFSSVLSASACWSLLLIFFSGVSMGAWKIAVSAVMRWARKTWDYWTSTTCLNTAHTDSYFFIEQPYHSSLIFPKSAFRVKLDIWRYLAAQWAQTQRLVYIWTLPRQHAFGIERGPLQIAVLVRQC
ncbi:hypothetical protein N657DRAFT_163157 [Parathielavia appendiculata]|uniref:Uncharacterized protein n=1 Tax=Parathielavia appendiculata TaxID=2587402 RepID=A0AAN6TT78_9PEZI|nr:hypothetical protein N657DRAFT_163157 [Parathielavia appendiculata]